MSDERIPDEDLPGIAHDVLELEDSDLVDHGIILVAYMNGETGKRELGWAVIGDPPIDQTIGLIALSQHRIDHETSEDL